MDNLNKIGMLVNVHRARKLMETREKTNYRPVHSCCESLCFCWSQWRYSTPAQLSSCLSYRETELNNMKHKTGEEETALQDSVWLTRKYRLTAWCATCSGPSEHSFSKKTTGNLYKTLGQVSPGQRGRGTGTKFCCDNTFSFPQPSIRQRSQHPDASSILSHLWSSCIFLTHSHPQICWQPTEVSSLYFSPTPQTAPLPRDFSPGFWVPNILPCKEQNKVTHQPQLLHLTPPLRAV